MPHPTLQRIVLYPIKSLDGLEVDRAEVLPLGALRWDRAWAIADAQGNFLNGKRTARVHRLRTRYELFPGGLILRLLLPDESAWREFLLPQHQPALEECLSDYFQQRVRLLHRPEGGFPDDQQAPGPTLVSTASLQEVARWFDLPMQEVRRRFRANLELGGVPAFWEDRLVLPGASQGRRFRLGGVELRATGVCQRCAVPPRHPDTGEPLPQFAREFARRRQETLPPWSPRERFDHFYRLVINTQVLRPGKLATGEKLRLLG